MRVQSIRAVGSRRGYGYYAWGIYELVARKRDGVLTWRLVQSGRWFRSDKHCRHAFSGIPIRLYVRHGTPLPPDPNRG